MDKSPIISKKKLDYAGIFVNIVKLSVLEFYLLRMNQLIASYI
jgi:hypothetical protein